MTSELELAFAFHVRAAKLPTPATEYRFHPGRRFRADFAWPHWKVLVEIDGGTRSHGRHTRHDGYSRDCEKQAEAVIAGWAVLRCTGEQVESGEAVGWTERLLAARGWSR